MTTRPLEQEIAHYFAAGPVAASAPGAMTAFLALRAALESGQVRAASPDPDSPTGWCVNAWVKKGILLGFRVGVLEQLSVGALSFVDKNTFPARQFTAADGVRLVPGGSSIRSGAYVDEGAMVDSHALVGSCAQIGKRVHLSAAAQIGGVLEPINASPVIIEDDVLVGGNTGVYEGTIVRKGAVLAAGTILTRGTPVFDLVKGQIIRATSDTSSGPGLPLIIPENAIVVPGSRAVNRNRTHPNAEGWGLSVYAPVIVKYRDDKTNVSTALEDLLR